MAESVDALVSNTSRFTPVPVRPRLRVLGKTLLTDSWKGFCFYDCFYLKLVRAKNLIPKS